MISFVWSVFYRGLVVDVRRLLAAMLEHHRFHSKDNNGMITDPKTSWFITTVIFCRVFGCSNKAGKTMGFFFYRFPVIMKHYWRYQWHKTQELWKKWRNIFALQVLNPDSCQYRVCYDHFITYKSSLIDFEFGLAVMPTMCYSKLAKIS
jgi:hypothetical protein